MDAPWRLTASVLADAIRTRRISSRDAVGAALDRIDGANRAVNAVVSVQAERALADAEAAERAVARGDPLGRLHGVPVTTEVNVDQAGLPTTNGVVAFADRVAPDPRDPWHVPVPLRGPSAGAPPRIAVGPMIERHGDVLARRAFELMMRRTPELDVPSLMRRSSPPAVP